MATGQAHADRLVVFGITGDLAKKMTLPSLYRLEGDGTLTCPIIGVAFEDWSLEQLQAHTREMVRAAAREQGRVIDESVLDRLCARMTAYVGGDFTDPDKTSPVVATTSRLLSTGVDVEDLKFVVLFRPVGSMVEFKQIIGRGTRLFPDKGKTSFEIIDYVGDRDTTTKRLLEGILAMEEEHAEDMKTLMEDFGKKGEPAKPKPRKGKKH